MKTSRILSAISFGIIVATPACGAKFAPIGNDNDAGVGSTGSTVGGNGSTVGGANQGQGGKSAVGGSTGAVCHYNNVNYLVGTSFPSSDGCNSCSCDASGLVACTMMFCAAGGSPSVGGAGSSGCVCSGPAPAAPTVQCADGTFAGPTCATQPDGTCSWTVTTCPVQGVGGAASIGGAAGIGGTSSVTCLYNNVNYLAGQSFKSPDGCNTCSCTSSGQIACTAMACAVGGSSGVGGASSSGCVCTGPSPAAPTVQCSDGSTATHLCHACGWNL
jgi:hypothetical protein